MQFEHDSYIRVTAHPRNASTQNVMQQHNGFTTHKWMCAIASNNLVMRAV
jgi:hypothetical protein